MDGSDLKANRGSEKFSQDHKHPKVSENNPEKTWSFRTYKMKDLSTIKSKNL